MTFNRKKFTTELKAIAALALPVIGTNYVNFGAGFTDQVFIGHLSSEYTQEKTIAEYLAGQGLALTFMWIVYFFSSGLLFGLDTTISQSYGAKLYGDCGKQLQTSLFVTLVMAIPVGLLWFSAAPILGALFGLSDNVRSVVAQVSQIQTLALIPQLCYDLLARYASNQGVVNPALIVGMLSLIVNGVCNWLFIYVFKMGFVGSPIATTTSRFILPGFRFVLIVQVPKKEKENL